MAPVAGSLARLRRALIPDGFLRGLVFILIGAPIMAFGLYLTMRTTWGVGPWDVLHIGLAQQVGFSVGRAHQLTGLSLVLMTLALGGRTVTLVTLLNTTLVGLWIDLYIGWDMVPLLAGWAGLIYVALGVAVLGFGIALYLHPGLGAGPRDGLMLTLAQRTGQPLYRVKMAMDISAMLTGLLLGGPAGLGTLVVAFGLGPAIHFFRHLLHHAEAHARSRFQRAAARPTAYHEGRTTR
ncbi:MAG: hypothetical protein BAA04_04430 [Firmicutes bacterium ZCTH02-B6]|nr:MAG: hypothetical protein BAA04_04430 [Firmicutes bacterium ZCTH02-B6]